MSFDCNIRFVLTSVLVGLGFIAVIQLTGNSLEPPTKAAADNKLNANDQDWRDLEVDNLTGYQILNYIRWRGDSECKLEHELAPLSKLVSGKKSICFDPEYKPEKESCLVYLFDIFHEWEVDESLSNYGCHVYSFDPVVKSAYNRTEHIHVYPYGLSNRNQISVHNWTMLTLPEIYKRLKIQHGSTVIDYLKLDTEDWDLRTLPQMLTSGILHR